MTQILLVSESTIKKYTNITPNMDAMYLLPAIQYAQDEGLQPIIGTHLFEKLCTLVKQGTISQDKNALYKELLDDYITPYLINKVLADIQIPISYKFRNQGVVQNTSDNTQTPSMHDLQYLIQFYNNKADFYANRLSDYLCTFATQYPEYHSTRSTADMPANKMAYNTGIYLG